MRIALRCLGVTALLFGCLWWATAKADGDVVAFMIACDRTHDATPACKRFREVVVKYMMIGGF